MTQKNYSKRPLYIIIAILLVVVVCSFWGGKIYEKDYWMQVVKDARDSISFSEERVLQLESELLCLEQLDSEDNNIQEDNYNDYLNERKNEKQIKDDINSIVHREYSKAYLDSLARNVRFN